MKFHWTRRCEFPVPGTGRERNGMIRSGVAFKLVLLLSVFLGGGAAITAAQESNEEKGGPPGAVKSAKTKALEAGAKVMQGNAPLKNMAKPQSGVDDLKGRVGHPTQDIPGVVDKDAPQQGSTTPAR